MLKPYIKQFFDRVDLSYEDAYKACEILIDHATDAQIAAFLTLLTIKGETIDELCGFISAIKHKSISFKLDTPAIDIVGTGGDNAGSLNISTTSALLTAACGVPVVKHGSRAATSKCGSADLLEALGYPIHQTPKQVVENVRLNNFGFCYSVDYYPGLAKTRKIRHSLGIPTVFNIIGPLLNAANVEHVILGVYDPKRVDLIAEVLFKLGTKRSIVFSGNKLDELSCLGSISAKFITEEGITSFTIDPIALGLRQCTLIDLKGDDALYNSKVIRDTLSGIDTPLTDTVILNAAVALFIYGKVMTLEDGVKLARKRIVQGNILQRNRLHEIILRKRRPSVKRKSLKAAILSNPQGGVIAEIKRASPSAGKIATISNPVLRAQEYVKAGACAISVLTDEGFEGSMVDLTMVASALKDTNAAILCKDFFLCPEQIAEAAQAGADAILIMVSVLHQDTLRMVKLAHEFGLEALVEVHNFDELEIALNSNADIIGVNQRDLRDFSMHPELFTQLITKIPNAVVRIAESGIESAFDAKSAFKLGFNAVLVGTTLSKLDRVDSFFNELYNRGSINAN